METKPGVVIIGAGLAGLAAALHLEASGYVPLILEASGAIGGRVKTESKDGFLLDAGFQVLNTSYREIPTKCKRDLKLKGFRPGAFYRKDEKWDFFSPYAFWRWDKETTKGIFALGKALVSLALKKPEGTTEKFIHEMGAPESWVDHFLAPFLRGVFLDKHLDVRAERFLKLFPTFVWGLAALPKEGMKALPEWFAKQLKSTEIRLNSAVTELMPGKAVLKDGSSVTADAILIAISGPQAAKLIPSLPKMKSRQTACDYFSIDAHKVKGHPYLWLDGRIESPVNNFSFLSSVQPSYAPRGAHLLSATTMGQHLPSTNTVRSYLAEELKLRAEEIVPLNRQLVEHALPSQEEKPPLSSPTHEGFYFAGEVTAAPSLNDAIASGRKAAELIKETL